MTGQKGGAAGLRLGGTNRDGMTRRRVLLAAAVRGVIYRRLEEIRFRTGVAILVTVAAAGGIAVSVITATAGA